jgi:hypothetical protein
LCKGRPCVEAKRETGKQQRKDGIIASFFLVSGVKDECLFSVSSVVLRQLRLGSKGEHLDEPSRGHRRRHGIVIGFGAGEKRGAA